MVFGIEFVKSNQYSNKFLLFWLGLFSLAFDFLPYLQEWTLRKICWACFSFCVHSWRIKIGKGIAFGGRTSPRPTAVFSIIYYSHKVLQPQSLLHCQCTANPLGCYPLGGATVNCMYCWILPGLGTCVRTLKEPRLDNFCILWLAHLINQVNVDITTRQLLGSFENLN